jgi:hypothetical protein
MQFNSSETSFIASFTLVYIIMVKLCLHEFDIGGRTEVNSNKITLGSKTWLERQLDLVQFSNK